MGMSEVSLTLVNDREFCSNGVFRSYNHAKNFRSAKRIFVNKMSRLIELQIFYGYAWDNAYRFRIKND
jgi:hypothetical protein